MMQITRSLVLAFTIASGLAVGAAEPASEDTAMIIDCSKPIGHYKGQHRHFSGGLSLFTDPADLKPLTDQIGTASERYALLDHSEYFKGETLEDARNPEMYDFSDIDQKFARAEKMGVQILPYLDNMPKKLSTDGEPHGPAKDPKVFAEVLKHVILHVTQGWANGHHHTVPYWEIWNEPDVFELKFWTGTQEQFFQLFEVVARELKTLKAPEGHPPYKIGGPALGGIETWGEPFIKYCADHKVPLDFFSHHHYGDNPQEFVDRIEQCRKWLDQYGFQDTELMLNEWNIQLNYEGIDLKADPGTIMLGLVASPRYNSAWAALHMAESLIRMERAPVDRACHFLLADDGQWNMGVMTCPRIQKEWQFPPAKDPDTLPAGCTPKLKWHFLKLFQAFSTTPEIVTLQEVPENVTAYAGVDTERKKCSVLLTNNGPERKCSLALFGFGSETAKEMRGHVKVANQANLDQGEAIQEQDASLITMELNGSWDGPGQSSAPGISLALPAESLVLVSVEKAD